MTAGHCSAWPTMAARCAEENCIGAARVCGADLPTYHATSSRQQLYEIEQAAKLSTLARVTTVRDAIAHYKLGAHDREKLINKFSDELISAPVWRVCFDQAFVDDQARKHYPGRTAATIKRNFFNPLVAALNKAAKDNLCPAPRIKKPRVQPAKRQRWLYPIEFENLVAAAAKHANHLVPILRFAVLTGSTSSQAIYLDWGDVDFEHAEVYVNNRCINSSVVVDLLKAIRKRQKEFWTEGSRVFRRGDGQQYADREYSGGQFKTALGTACRIAGIQNFCFGDLRLTYAVWRYAEHRDLKTLRRETGWRRDSLQRVMNIRVPELDVVRGELAKLYPGGNQ